MLTRRVAVYSIVVAVGIAMALWGCGGPTQPPSAPDAAPPKTQEDAAAETPGTAADEQPVDGDWLMTRLAADTAHLNPYLSSDSVESNINGYIFESLLDRDNETLDMKPLMAEAWEVSDDHLTYTFTLREGMKFSDGTPVTAEDVKFSFDTVLDPTVDAPHLRNYYKDIQSVEIADEKTIRISCTRPYYRHLVMIGGLQVLPKHVYGEGDFNKHPNNDKPIGSGPYILKEWKRGEKFILERNENYWGEKPHLLKRVYIIVNDNNAAFEMLERQDLDTDGLEPELWVNRASSPEFMAKFNKFTYYSPQYSYIGWNLRRSQFQDKMVRRALTMLVNRPLILEKIFHGLGVQVTGNFFKKNPEYNPDIKPWPYEPEEAKRLLDQAGWVDSDGNGVRDKGGVAFEFELLLRSGSNDDRRIAGVLQNEFKRAGIDMSIRVLEWATMLEKVDGRNFDAVRLAWSMPPDPDPYQVWHSSQAEGGSNFVGFVNEEADRLIDAAREEFDREVRIRLYRRFHEILHEEQPYTFLWSREALLAVDKRFHNIIVYPYGVDSKEWFVPKQRQRYE